MARFDELFADVPQAKSGLTPEMADSIFASAPTREEAAQQRLAAADPNAPRMMADTSKGWADYFTDPFEYLREGLGNALVGATDAPRRALNVLTQDIPQAVVGGGALGQMATDALGVQNPLADMIGSLTRPLRVERPEAQTEWMQGQRDRFARDLELGASAGSQAAGESLAQADGIGEMLQALAENPSLIQNETGRLLGMMAPVVAAGPAALPAAGGVFGQMNAEQVEQQLLADPAETIKRFGDEVRASVPELANASDAELVEFIASTRSDTAFLRSAIVNSILPRLIPGGATLERLAVGKVPPLATTRAGGAVRGGLGEFAAESLQGGADQAIQNLGTGAPTMQGVAQAGLLEGLLAGPLGAVAGAARRPDTKPAMPRAPMADGSAPPVNPILDTPQPDAQAAQENDELEGELARNLGLEAPILTNAEKQALRDAGVPGAEIARMRTAEARARLAESAPAPAPPPQGLGDFLSQVQQAQPFQRQAQPEAETRLDIDPTIRPGAVPPDAVAAPENLDTTRRWEPVRDKTGKVVNDARGRPKRRPIVDYGKGDGLREWLAASGGVNFEELRAYAGADPAARKDASVQYPFGMKNWPVLSREGMGLETMIEKMQADGWLPEGQADMAEAADMVMRAINGEQVFHPFEGAGERFARQAEQDWQNAQAKAEQDLGEIGETPQRVDALAERMDDRADVRDESLSLADQARRWAASNPAPAELAPMFRRREVGQAPPKDSPEWQRFTAQTKVRDPEGNVVPLYHGTGEDFTVFDDTKAGYATQHTTAPLGHFLTGNRDLAEGYARKAANGRPADERVIEAWVAINNPYQMTLADMQEIDSPDTARAIKGWLQSQGYDGIHVAEADNWIAFESGQIKDVQANRGTFDRANPDMRFSRGGVPESQPAEGSNMAREDYGIEHSPMSVEAGAATLDSLESSFGEDIYGPNALQYFGSGDAREAAVVRQLRSLRGKPDALVTIYRGVPSGAAGINPGDWVTLSKEAAQDYADQHDGGRVVSLRVPASHVTAWADSLLEQGYFPPSQPTRLSTDPDMFSRGVESQRQQPSESTTREGQANGIPQGLPAELDADSRSLARAINGFVGPSGAQARFRTVRQDSLPDALRGALAALEDATGTRVVIFRNLTPQAFDFNGVSLRDGVLYVNEAADNPATTIAGHEFVHDLRAQAPDLYAELEAEVRRQGKLGAYANKLRRQGDANAESVAPEELTADAVGDALTDRGFLELMAREAPALFKRVAEAFMRFLDTLMGRVRDLGSNQYLSDVQAFRDVLADVLRRYEARASGEGGEPQFSRAPAVTSPEFRQWFGDSKVVDENGEPLVVYHGTKGDFQTFKPSVGSYGRGIYLTPSGWFAGAAYADSEGGNVMPVHAAISSPYVIEASDTEPHALSGLAPNEMADWLRRNGFDGVIVELNGEVQTVMALDPSQIKSATGNVGAYGQRPVTEAEAAPLGMTAEQANAQQARGDIRFSRKTPQQAEQERDQLRQQAARDLPQQRGTPGWNYDRSVWEGRKGQLMDLQAKLQDKMNSWRDVQNQIAAQVGKAIPDAQNVYRIENLMHGRVKERLDALEESQIVPLVKAMQQAKVKPAELEEYLYARHAQERNAEIAKINPRMPDGGSGMTNAEAKSILAKADAAKLDPLAKMVDAMAKATRRRMLANGLVTQDQFDAMEAQYQHYVPLRGKKVRVDEATLPTGGAGRGVDGRRAPVREALGRGAGNRAENILAEVIGDAQRSIIMAEKARVGRAAMRLVLANPNPDLWEVEPVQTEFKKDANGEVYEAVINDWNDQTIVGVRVKGQLYKLKLNVPLARALNHVGVDQIGAVTRFAGALNRYFSAVLTKYNPAFTGVNATRDIIFGLTGMAAEHGEVAALKAAASYPKAVAAAFRQARRKGGSGKWDTYAQEFADAGGKTGYVNMPSVEDLARMIGKGNLLSYSPTGLSRALRGINDAVGVMNDTVENALRLSAYGTLRERGMSAEAAAEYAKNLTVNFNRKGIDGTKLNAWLLFYNAATQGVVRTTALLKKPKTWGYLGSLVAVQAIAAMYAMGLEDDDGEPLASKVPEHVWRRNIVLVTPDGGVVTIPMPYGFNWFTYMGGRVVRAMMNDDPSAPDSVASIVGDATSALVESFSPVPLDDGAFGIVPTAVRIPLAIQTNRDDLGRQIRKDDPYARSDIPRASMGRPDTLEVFKLAAKGLNRIGGGDDYKPPVALLDFAPEDLEYLVRQAGGGALSFLVDTAMLGQKAAGEFPVEARDVPLSKRFYQGINEQASQAALFYQRRDTIERGLNRVRDTYRREGKAAAQRLMDSMPELSGATFRRRKSDGKVIESNGSPQIVPKSDRSVFGQYREASKAVRARNETFRDVYSDAPADVIPTAATRERDRKLKAEDVARMEAQRAFNAAWTRDVTGTFE